MPSERQYQRHHTHRMAAWRRPDPQKGRADGDWGGQGPPWAPCHRRGGRREGLPGGLRPGPATGRRGGNCHQKKNSSVGGCLLHWLKGAPGQPLQKCTVSTTLTATNKEDRGGRAYRATPTSGVWDSCGTSDTGCSGTLHLAQEPTRVLTRKFQGGSWVLKRRQKQRKTEHPSVQECPGEAFSVQK